jgi:hypothetical protein
MRWTYVRRGAVDPRCNLPGRQVLGEIAAARSVRRRTLVRFRIRARPDRRDRRRLRRSPVRIVQK